MNKLACLVSLVVVTGCSGANNRPRKTLADLGGDVVGGDVDLTMNSIDPGGNNDDCPDSAKLVYVVDENNKLSSFDPPTLKFKDLGTLNCPAQFGATPFSMSVDRTARAWVLYSSGELFFVDTETLACTKAGFQSGQAGFGLNFGMGFVADSAGAQTEHLFVADASSLGFGGPANLGRIDPTTLKLSVVGQLNGNPELTGTGDANLWGFFPDDTNPRVSMIDQSSGAESNTYRLGSQVQGSPSAWAFAFWGGDFWIFLQRDTDASTIVWHLTGNGAVSKAIPNTGRTIVGAGVSTCAPIIPG